jgi:hypothetical protein
LATLGATETALVVALLVWRHALLVPWWVIAIVMVFWIALSIVLRTHPKTWGKERPVLDWWSVPHFIGGTLFGFFGIGVGWVLAAATVWEGVEIVARTKEYPTNRVADIALALSGWIVAMLVAGGAFPLT